MSARFAPMQQNMEILISGETWNIHVHFRDTGQQNEDVFGTQTIW